MKCEQKCQTAASETYFNIAATPPCLSLVVPWNVHVMAGAEAPFSHHEEALGVEAMFGGPPRQEKI